VLAEVAAGHEHRRELQRSFYYDGQQRWWWTYPPVPRDMLPTIPNQLKLTQNAMVWSAPYPGAPGKGPVASLLTPVYFEDLQVGTVGTELALQVLDAIVEQQHLRAGRALLVDSNNRVLADSLHTARVAGATAVQLSDAVPGAPASFVGDSREWLQFPIRGTSWTLLLYVSNAAARAYLMEVLRPLWVLALGLVLALTVLGWLQSRRFVRPALLLADYMERVDADANADPPRVARAWVPWFKRVQRNANDRRDRMETVVQRNRQLEHSIKMRNQALREASLPKSE
jgi:hypothetical protein